MKAFQLRDHGRFTDVSLYGESGRERQQLKDALAADEPVTLTLRGEITGDVTGVVTNKSGTHYVFRIPRVDS